MESLMHCLLDISLPLSSTRCAVWRDEWLLLGSDCGALKALQATQISSSPNAQSSKNFDHTHQQDGGTYQIQCHNGHAGPVCCVCADVTSGLLATADAAGNVCVWEETRGDWHQRSTFYLGCSGELVGIQWVHPSKSPSQVSLCGLHGDGRLLNVTADGLRLWSRDLRKSCSCFAAFFNGTGFIIATSEGELQLHDSRGIYMRKITPRTEAAKRERITAVAWQPGSWAVRPVLVCYSSGHALLLSADGESSSHNLDTGLSSCVAAEWNPSGTVAALFGLPVSRVSSSRSSFLGGTQNVGAKSLQNGTVAGTLLVLFHACGEVAASLNLGDSKPRALAWAVSGEQLAAAAEKSIFILSLRRHSLCCAYGENTVAAAGTFCPDQRATEVSFTLNHGNCRIVRRFRGPRFLASGKAFCAVVPHVTAALPPTFLWQDDRCGALHQLQHQDGPHRLPDTSSAYTAPTPMAKPQRESRPEGFPVELCDSMGNTVETLFSPVGPRHAVLLPEWLVVSDSSQNLWIHHLTHGGKSNSTAVSLSSLTNLNSFKELLPIETSSEQICSLSGSGTCLLVAQSGGQLLRLTLSTEKPQLQLEAFGTAPSPLKTMKLNNDATALAGMDMHGRLHILKVTAPKEQTGSPSSCFAEVLCEPLEDVLDCMWANDHNDLIAVMLRAGLFLVQTTRQGVSPSSLFGFDSNKKLITGSVCLVDFRNLCASAVCLPTMLRRKITEEQHVQFSTFDAQPLLQMRQLLEACRTGTQDRGFVVSLQQAATLAASFSHSTLWRLLAKAALELEELEIAEEALVRCEDYCSLQVLKKARSLNPRGDGRPLISLLAGDILGAGAFYEAQRRRDHAAHLFASFGLWSAASDTLKLAASSRNRWENSCLDHVRTALAEALKERGKWRECIDLYSSVRPQEGLIEAYFFSEKYDELEELANAIPDGNKELLFRAAQLLAASGKGSASAAAFLKAGMPELAVDAALEGAEWAQAVSFARQHCDKDKLDKIATTYKIAVQHQSKNCNNMDIVEAFLNIGAFEAAAQELTSLPSRLLHVQNPQRQRKMHVSAALLVRQNRLSRGSAKDSEEVLCPPTLETVCSRASGTPVYSIANANMLHQHQTAEEEKHWRCAAACHLYLLCCFHLSERRARAALCVAVRLWECYSREFPPHLSAHMLFISAYKSREWNLCSQALHTLELHAQESQMNKQRLEDTSLSFSLTRQTLQTPKKHELCCPECNALSAYWECFCPSCDLVFPWCGATGLPVRYATWLLQQGVDGQEAKTKPESPVSPVFSPFITNDTDSFWPHGGPAVPETCGTCGTTIVAWGPGGPLRSCPLCNQLFSSQLDSSGNPQILTPVFTFEDAAPSYILKVNPEEVCLQEVGVNSLASV